MIGTCFHCFQEYTVQKDDLTSEICLEEMLQLKVNKNSGLKNNNVGKAIENINSNLNELELLQSDPNFFISNYFYELRNQVDLRRENLKLEIDQFSDQVIKDLDFYEQECKKIAKFQLDIQKELEILKSSFEEFKDFDSFDMNDKKMKETVINVLKFKPLLSKEVNRLKKKILDNKSFKLKQGGLRIRDYFGHLDVKKQVIANITFYI